MNYRTQGENCIWCRRQMLKPPSRPRQSIFWTVKIEFHMDEKFKNNLENLRKEIAFAKEKIHHLIMSRLSYSCRRFIFKSGFWYLVRSVSVIRKQITYCWGTLTFSGILLKFKASSIFMSLWPQSSGASNLL